jgi:Winged helix DNA-binding domain
MPAPAATAARFGRRPRPGLLRPNQGQQVRFTRPDTWLGGWEGHDPDKAMDEVTRRFLAASGPVTREDFARWWGIPSPAKGAKLRQRLGDEVARVEVEGMAAHALAADPPGLARRAAETEAERLAAVAGGQLELIWAGA